MVTPDTDVDELLDLVLSAGKDVEENSKQLTDMTEVLKKGYSTTHYIVMSLYSIFDH